MKAAFESNGGKILQGSDVDAYLKWRGEKMGATNVGGITDNAQSILLPSNPTRSAVFEEFIHTAQHRTGRFNDLVAKHGNTKAEVLLEIEAAEKLIRARRAWKIPLNEVREIIQRLRQLRIALKKLA